jgi:hypothetical protein
MPHLEGGPQARQQPLALEGAQEAREARQVGVELGRELEEHGAQRGAERPHAAEQAIERRSRRFEPLEMGEEAAGLHGEQEVVAGLRAPGAKGRLAGQPVERVVELDRREVARVERQPLARRQPDRVEALAPVRIDVAAGAEVEPSAHALSASKRRAAALGYDAPRKEGKRGT